MMGHMARKRSESTSEKRIGITIRIPESQHMIYMSLLPLNKENAQEHLRKCIEKYVKANIHLLNMDEINKTQKTVIEKDKEQSQDKNQ